MRYFHNYVSWLNLHVLKQDLKHSIFITFYETYVPYIDFKIE